MKEKTGEVFSIAKDNAPFAGCTVSKEICGGDNYVICFSLAKNTDISAEIFPYYKLILPADGVLEVYGTEGCKKELHFGEAVLAPADVPVGMRTSTGAVYTEISIRRNDTMNEVIRAGEVFSLAELVPYADGKIVNMDIVRNAKMKFVVMAFDAGTGLSEHAAPGEALVFAIEGEGIIGYEGREYPIKAGENFHFAKNGLHYVKADRRFKMALFLTLE